MAVVSVQAVVCVLACAMSGGAVPSLQSIKIPSFPSWYAAQASNRFFLTAYTLAAWKQTSPPNKRIGVAL
jgi:hypothetical protein